MTTLPLPYRHRAEPDGSPEDHEDLEARLDAHRQRVEARGEQIIPSSLSSVVPGADWQRLPLLARQARNAPQRLRPSVSSVRAPGEKHVAGEGRTDTCLRARGVPHRDWPHRPERGTAWRSFCILGRCAEPSVNGLASWNPWVGRRARRRVRHRCHPARSAGAGGGSSFRARERLVTLSRGEPGTVAARRRALAQVATALVERDRGVTEARVRVRPMRRRTGGRLSARASCAAR